MKILCYLIIATILNGCVSIPNSSLSNKENDTKFSQTYKDNIDGLNKFNVFSYRVPSYEPRLLMGVFGHLMWDANCLVFIPKDTTEKVTPLFPVQTTKISSDGKYLTVSGGNFTVGNEVILGGSIVKTSDIKIDFFTKGKPECLFEKTLVII